MTNYKYLQIGQFFELSKKDAMKLRKQLPKSKFEISHYHDDVWYFLRIK